MFKIISRYNWLVSWVQMIPIGWNIIDRIVPQINTKVVVHLAVRWLPPFLHPNSICRSYSFSSGYVGEYKCTVVGLGLKFVYGTTHPLERWSGRWWSSYPWGSDSYVSSPAYSPHSKPKSSSYTVILPPPINIQFPSNFNKI